jgi:hypothetical protein
MKSWFLRQIHHYWFRKGLLFPSRSRRSGSNGSAFSESIQCYFLGQRLNKDAKADENEPQLMLPEEGLRKYDVGQQDADHFAESRHLQRVELRA